MATVNGGVRLIADHDVAMSWQKQTTSPDNLHLCKTISSPVSGNISQRSIQCAELTHRLKTVYWPLKQGLFLIVNYFCVCVGMRVGMRVRIKRRMFFRHQKIIITGWNDNINNNAIRTHERFCNKKAN